MVNSNVVSGSGRTSSRACLGIALAAACGCFIEAAVAEDWNGRMAVGVSALSFHYAENRHGATVNEETGRVPGLHLELGAGRGRWRGGLEVTYQAGEASYTGTTLVGAPIDSRTDETLLDAALRLSYRVDHERFPPNTELYAGLGYLRWDRDIATTASASGLDETYRWPYLIGGARLQLAGNGRDLWSLDLEWVRPVNPKLNVTFKNGLDEVDLEPQARDGVRMMLRWRRPLNHGFSLAAQLGYAHWRLGASNGAGLSRNGIPLNFTVLEPASETNHVGVLFLLERRL